ncbi:hypothetical protein GCM10009754_02190 [Amycolatopsis minnesotensis]|uniref:HTH tetR-type domain-containing protein n=1 Tax=Amycolatopsis minnesotensis TaxID=337894 RepID=A0ABP5BBJ8_9PSEU
MELLDAGGEGGLTFRALTERLATGPGAIYWHAANKGELLGAGRNPRRGTRPVRRDRGTSVARHTALDAVLPQPLGLGGAGDSVTCGRTRADADVRSVPPSELRG